MIVRVFFATRTDGVNLYRTYSDSGFMIRQIQTGALYDEAIDVETAEYSYEETDTPIGSDEMLEPQNALDIIFGEVE